MTPNPPAREHYVSRVLDVLAARPDTVAVRWRDLELTGRGLRDAVLHARDALAATGLPVPPEAASPAVGLLTEANHPALLAHRYAAHLLGATVVHLRSVNPGPDGALLDADAQAAILAENGAGVLVVDPPHARHADSVRARTPHPLTVVVADGPAAGGEVRAPEPRSGPVPTPGALDRAAVVTYTSGSTGRPKGVRQPLAAWSALVLGDAAQLAAEEPVMLVVTPLSHAAGPMADAVLCAGGTLVLHERFEAAAVLDAVAAHRVTRTYLAVPHLYALLDHPGLAACDIGSLRALIYSGSPASTGRLERAREAFGPRLVQCYGTTEAGRVTVLEPVDHWERELLPSAGRPFPGVDVRVCAPGGGTRPLPDGATGEVLVRSPQMMSHYVGDPEASRRVLRDGWLRTGDLGHWDAYGYLHLVDRLDGVIKTAGVKVHPGEVARALLATGAVAEAVVHRVVDGDAGEHVGAAVTAAAGNGDGDGDGRAGDPRELLGRLTAAVARSLSPAHAPSRIALWSRIPLTDNGKPDLRRIGAPAGDPDVIASAGPVARTPRTPRPTQNTR
ncbi:fatty acid--CoA ligase [Streptomyces sp. WAC07061]|uniref:class I adenylate-forming enzyme family protein n=1 Tax=Streptomyces sp. WAC07061 TaxID=2487410 RepID=UPI000F79ED76|nr:fatty acid--CoA ligase family protein [Streptomyces sp. WAC07061]RSS52876.1 fatty acid--CoA ligase [Streptomyces sp. WAC07061]